MTAPIWDRCAKTPAKIICESYVVAYDKMMTGREAAAFIETELRRHGWMIRAVPLRSPGKKMEAGYGADDL